MSERTYDKYEIVRWGYVALVCSALAFTTFTRAAARTEQPRVRSVVQAADVSGSVWSAKHL